MPQQLKSTPGKDEQSLGAPAGEGQDSTARIIANARRAVEASAAPRQKADEDRDLFVQNAQPVADALRKSGRPVEAKQLEEAAQAIGMTKGLGPEKAGQGVGPAPGSAEERPLKEVMASVFAAIDKDPALRALPAAKALRKASDSLDNAGMLNITVRGGLVVSFATNFADNFGRAQKLGQAPATAAGGSVVARQKPRASAAPAAPAPVATGAPVPQAAPAVSAAPAPRVTAPAAPAPVQPAPIQPAQPVAAVVAPVAPAPPARRPEIRYVAAPPDAGGLLGNRLLKEQPAHNALFQLVVDANDPARAQLLPAPGAEARIVSSLLDAMDNAYTLRSLPDAGRPHLVIESPTQLVRTDGGWRVTEKGAATFKETPGLAQAAAPEPASVRQVVAAPVEAPQLMPYGRADIPDALLAKMGVQVADLERTGQLAKLLLGQKTDLINGFSLGRQSGEAVPFAAKLVLQRDEQGAPVLKIDLPKHNLVIPREVMGKEVTPAMQAELQQNGVLPLTAGFRDGKGQPFTAYLAVDKEMNRVVAVRPDGLHIPKEVLGVKLDPEASRQLLEGKAAALVGMTNSRNQVFDATVQLDPVKRELTFREVRPHQAAEQLEPTRRRGLRA